jgi:unsaturated rhamnogalacturonyl hydrolase
MKQSASLAKVQEALLCMQRYSWEQGVAAQAFLESGKHDLAVLFAKEAVVRQLDDGRLGVMGDNLTVTDPAANGEAVLFAAGKTGEQIFSDAAERMLLWLLHTDRRATDGTLYHRIDKRQIWVDSFYMAPPFLAVAGHPQEAMKQIEGFRKYLWSPEKRMYSHIWDDENRDFVRKQFWGVGNGWAAAGMARVIRTLRQRLPQEKKKLVGYLKELIDGCLTYLRPDGLFHDVIDDNSTFVETNAAQMISYSIYRGVEDGYLDNSYLNYACRMREAATRKVDQYGLVQGVCGSPNFDRPGTAPEGQAFFLLMEAAAAAVEE